jgi:hypothetical protein
MATLKEYFEKNRYSAKYHLGDRIRGFWNKIPFSGTVAIDSVVYEGEKPHITVFLDLPIKYENTIHTIINIKHSDIIKDKIISVKDKNGKSKKSGSSRPTKKDSISTK